MVPRELLNRFSLNHMLKSHRHSWFTWGLHGVWLMSFWKGKWQETERLGLAKSPDACQRQSTQLREHGCGDLETGICTFTTPFVILCYGLSKVDRSEFKKKKITWAICGEQLKKKIKKKKSIHEDGTKRGELSGVRTIHSAGSNLCGRTTGDNGAATWFKTPHCGSGSLEADGQSSSEGREAALMKMWVSTAFLWQGMSSGPLQ